MYGALIRHPSFQSTNRRVYSVGNTNPNARKPSEATVLLKQGKLEEALQAFYKKPNSVFVASSLISHLGKQRTVTSASVDSCLTVYNEVKKNVKPDTGLLFALVEAARRQKASSKVLGLVWEDVRRLRIPVDSSLLSSLLLAFSEGSSLPDLPQRILADCVTKGPSAQPVQLKGAIDAQLCAVLVKSFAQSKDLFSCIRLLDWMENEEKSRKPENSLFNNHVYSRFLECAARIDSVELGQRILRILPPASSNHKDTLFLETATLSFHAKCGSIHEAAKIFKALEGKKTADLTTWNVMISGYCKRGDLNSARNLLQRLFSYGLRPDAHTYLPLISACSDSETFSLGSELYSDLVSRSVKITPALMNALTFMFGKWKGLQDAVRVYLALSPNTPPDVVTLNSLLSIAIQEGRLLHTLALLRQLTKNGDVSPNATTLTLLLDECGRTQSVGDAEALQFGEEIRDLASHLGFSEDPWVIASLIYMYGKKKDIDTGYLLFQEGRSSLGWKERAPIQIWNKLLEICLDTNDIVNAGKFFREMKSEGTRLNHVSYLRLFSICAEWRDLELGREVALHLDSDPDYSHNKLLLASKINMYGKADSYNAALSLFMEYSDANKSLLDANIWSVMITLCATDGRVNAAQKLWSTMLASGVEPDHVTYISLFNLCADTPNLCDLGKEIANHFKQGNRFTENRSLFRSLLAMYGRCFGLEEALLLFEEQKNTIKMTTNEWNVLLSICSKFDLLDESQKICSLMKKEGITLDTSTFSILLSIAAHGRFLDYGKQLHAEIIRDFPKYLESEFVATSLIQMYGKCGNLPEAEAVFKTVATTEVLVTVMIQAYTDNAKPSEGVQLYQKWKEANKVASDKLLRSALNAFTSLEEPASASAIFTQMTSRGIVQIEDVEKMARLCCRLGKLETAEHVTAEHANRLLRSSRDDEIQTQIYGIWQFLFEAAIQAGDVTRMESVAGRLLAMNPDNIQVYRSLCKAFGERGLKDKETMWRQKLKRKELEAV
eukprot:TRINITY_DN5883_c0_g1_i1.p1 TRINITY_DN5883_c0_g1~~TRINITY_DN5883_c0_g1_i1.p1  ORF type:complete len:1006 (+),score=185.56 TRINITY_DN5883_c0_g1_i1:84-3101(+)